MLLTAEQAAARLGIKTDSLYAYVSRGLVERHHGADGRSMFSGESIEELARRGKPRLSSRSTSLHLLIETRLTRIDSHRIFYRGLDAASLARTHTFEEVAELLWLGALPDVHHPWSGAALTIDGDVGLAESLPITVARAAAADPLRAELAPEAVAAVGRQLIATLIDSLAPPSAPRVPRLSLAGGRRLRATVAGRLWAALAPRRPAPGMVETLNAFLVLLADHELAASTLAARVAASARADPYGVVGSGLGVFASPLHGQASTFARRLLDDAAEVGAAPAIAEALRSWRTVPGFGQRLYPAGDPRAVQTLGLLRDAIGGDRTLAVADAVISAYRTRSDLHPNVDFAMGVFSRAAQLPIDAGEVIFAIARIAGWLAHAIEEYAEAPLRFRPRAAYVGVS